MGRCLCWRMAHLKSPTLAEDVPGVALPAAHWESRMPRARSALAHPAAPTRRVALRPAGSARAGQTSARRLRTQLFGIFRLVERFLLLTRLDVERYRLHALVQDLHTQVGDCFALAQACIPAAAALRADLEQCLQELGELLESLRDGVPLTRLELVHALDGVVVHCVVLDLEQQEAERSWLVAAEPAR